MNTTELIELAKVCEAYTVEDGVVTTVIFGEEELQQFAKRIEQPHLQRILELTQRVEKVADSLEQAEKRLTEIAFKACANLDTKDAQIAQLREALCRCQGWVKAYGEPETKAIVCKALEQTK